MASTGNRLGGICTLTVDGTTYALRGNWSVAPNAVKREGVAGQDAVHGYTEMPVVPVIKGDFTTVPGLSLQKLAAITNSTVQLVLANGSTYILNNAWVKGPFEVNAAEGRFAVEFEGLTCTENLNIGTSS